MRTGPGARAAGYPADISPFRAAVVPDGWAVIENHPGLQFLAPGTLFEPDPEAVPLGPADVPEILELIDLARPGPFLARPVALGGYAGVWWGGRLIAMVSSHGDTRCDLRCTEVPTILLISCGQPLKLLGIGAGHERDLVPTIEPGHSDAPLSVVTQSGS